MSTISGNATITRIINLSSSTGVIYARCFEGCYTITHAEKIWCWLWTVPKLSSYLELKSIIEACRKGSCHTTYRSCHVAPLRWDVSVCIQKLSLHQDSFRKGPEWHSVCYRQQWVCYTFLLDLSAAFDTVDHSIVLSRLRDRFGVNSTVLAWFESYLTSRKQFIQVSDCRSTQHSLERGVLQGSVLRPLLYLLYTSPVADIIKLHKLQYHLYADDTQLYISFKTHCSYVLSLAKRRLECCVNDIDCWMVNNGLKLNQDKTELVLISSKFRSRPSLEFIQVDDEKIQPKSSARNLGVIIDQCLDLTDHVIKICVSYHYHLRNIAKIRKYLSEETSEILVDAARSSHLLSAIAFLP